MIIISSVDSENKELLLLRAKALTQCEQYNLALLVIKKKYLSILFVLQ